jgi:uroporphyrinogen-III decarboxylase
MRTLLPYTTLFRSRIREATRTCLEKLAPLKGYIVQDGANIPPGTPVENINAMMEAAVAYGCPS